MVEIIESSLGNDALNNNKVKLYPNPTTGIFTIDLGNEIENSEISIHDLNGRLIKVFYKSNKSLIDIDLELDLGLYFVTVISDNKKSIFRLLKK